MSYLEHAKCRVCCSTDLAPVFDLSNQALANYHCLPGEPRQGLYPLKVNFCRKCGLAQLSVVVNRNQLYTHYTYVSSSSQLMQRHYDRLFLDIGSEQPAKRIVEIASNNGDCLQFAKDRGYEVLGIDPALNIADMANARGIPTLPDFFSSKVAEAAKTRMTDPGVVLARHVFAHVDNWREFMESLAVLATKDTLVVLEFPYVLDLFRNGAWDSIYHEHLSIISLKPVAKLLEQTPFHIHRIIRVGIHCGALVVMLRHNDSGIQPHLSADEFLSEENVTEGDWNIFASKARAKISALSEMVYGLRQQSNIVSMFGASAKGSVLVNACSFTEKDIAFCTDNSPLKPGRLIPGTQIPVIDEGEMLSQHPDYAICAAWNFRTEILSKMEKYRKRSGKFIFPTDTGWEVV